jgi:hypothetical protein
LRWFSVVLSDIFPCDFRLSRRRIEHRISKKDSVSSPPIFKSQGRLARARNGCDLQVTACAEPCGSSRGGLKHLAFDN